MKDFDLDDPMFSNLLFTAAAMENEMATQNKPAPEFNIQKIFCKYFNFELQNLEDLQNTQWAPNMQVNFSMPTKKIKDGLYEVTVELKTVVTNSEKEYIKCDCSYTGYFLLKGYEQQQIDYLNNVQCPQLLYPYIVENITMMIVKAGFPAIYIPPLSFESIYQQKLEKQNQTMTETV